MHGLPTIGTIGFGWFEVSGRRRVPSPPAITTAFTPPPPDAPSTTYSAAATSARPRPIQKSHERPVGARCPTTSRIPSDSVEDPGRGLAEEADGELVAARQHEPVAADEQERHAATMITSATTAAGRRATSRITAASIISRSASGSANLPNSRLDVPAAREPAVDLVGDAGDGEDDRRRPARGRRRLWRRRRRRPGPARAAAIVSAFGSCASGAGTARGRPLPQG